MTARPLRSLLALILLLGAAGLDIHAPWVASYRIDVTLDVEDGELRGRESLAWRNLSDEPVDEIWLHLYWNAARSPDSTFLREIDPTGTSVALEEYGWIDLTRIRSEAGADLLEMAEFRQPDDGRDTDRTLLWVPLAEPLRPGESVELEIDWESRIPLGFDRTGRTGDFHFISQWYPKAAVAPTDTRTPHQYHAASEFFADFGVYDVSITVPAEFVVGATGSLRAERVNGDGTATYSFYQEDVHDFAWVADTDLLDKRHRFSEPGLRPVDVRILVQPEHGYAADRYLAATLHALRYFGRRYGPYPYGVLTVVDPQAGSTAGGMEYPTLVTGGVGYRDPTWTLSPEAVTIHEVGHQYWYGIVATDEFEAAWLDEGFTSYSTARALEERFGPGFATYLLDEGLPLPYEPLVPPRGVALHPVPRAISWSPIAGFLRDLPPVAFPAWAPQSALDIERRDLLQSGLAEADPLEALSWEFLDVASYSSQSYSRAALFLATLEEVVGRETFDRVMREWFDQGRFRHPTSGEFLEILERVSGRDLTQFFESVVHGEGMLDLFVESVDVEDTADGFLSEVVVRCRGPVRLPVVVRTEFEDGTHVDEVWSGEESWKRFRYEGASPAVMSTIAPDRTLWLDVDLTDNARTVKPDGSAARRRIVDFLAWAQNVLFWFGMMV